MERVWKTISLCLITVIMLSTIYYNRTDIFGICKRFIISVIDKKAVTKGRLIAFEDDFKSILQTEDSWINGYGTVQKFLLKRDLGDVLCDKKGELYLKDNGNVSSEDISVAASNIIRLYEFSEKLEIPFLFVQCPYKNYSNVEELKGYGEDKTEDNENELIEKLNEKNIPTLDLRNSLSDSVHYMTDHHWTCEAAFKANAVITQYLYDELGIGINRHELELYCNEYNYDTICYQSSFLGSIGIRAGEGYTKKEDFSIIIPEFYTNFQYTHIIEKEVVGFYEGNFKECFIDEERLLNKEYKNKYMAFLRGGSVENIIENKTSKNELKALLISHSYGRAMAPYMSMFYRELRYLDPQVGRYNESLQEYIQDYRPDVIVIMFNGEIQL